MFREISRRLSLQDGIHREPSLFQGGLREKNGTVGSYPLRRPGWFLLVQSCAGGQELLSASSRRLGVPTPPTAVEYVAVLEDAIEHGGYRGYGRGGFLLLPRRVLPFQPQQNQHSPDFHQKCGRPFQLIIHGRFWVFTEAEGKFGHKKKNVSKRSKT